MQRFVFDRCRVVVEVSRGSSRNASVHGFWYSLYDSKAPAPLCREDLSACCSPRTLLDGLRGQKRGDYTFSLQFPWSGSFLLVGAAWALQVHVSRQVKAGVCCCLCPYNNHEQWVCHALFYRVSCRGCLERATDGSIWYEDLHTL